MALLTAAGLLGGFVNILAGNGSAFTLPALQFAVLSGEADNGTNRLSITTLGIVDTVTFYRQGLIDWRSSIPIAGLAQKLQAATGCRGLFRPEPLHLEPISDFLCKAPIAVIMILGSVAGSLVAVNVSELVTGLIVSAGLLVILGMLLFRLERWISGKGDEPRSLDPGQVAAYIFTGLRGPDPARRRLLRARRAG